MYIATVHQFRLIRKLRMACFGAYGNCMSIQNALCCRLHSPVVYAFSGSSLKKREWNVQPQQGLGELEKISARATDQTVALGWILSALHERSRCGKVTSLTRLATLLLFLTICVAAQPNPVRFSSFPILLFMRWHFYPPIKTFKGPLSKRKECCFNSVVAPCLGPFFSVCNQPILASRCSPASAEQRGDRLPSETYDSSSARTMSPLFTAPSTQSRL